MNTNQQRTKDNNNKWTSQDELTVQSIHLAFLKCKKEIMDPNNWKKTKQSQFNEYAMTKKNITTFVLKPRLQEE